ncbi:uncharacterized protein YceK [Rhodoplanes tepidamans]|nr:uncharacterized protein YceK [Rhodoplanes tepidamans]
MRAVLLVLVVGLGLGLAGCSKCDIPTWGYAACRAGPPVQ